MYTLIFKLFYTPQLDCHTKCFTVYTLIAMQSEPYNWRKNVPSHKSAWQSITHPALMPPPDQARRRCVFFWTCLHCGLLTSRCILHGVHCVTDMVWCVLPTWCVGCGTIHAYGVQWPPSVAWHGAVLYRTEYMLTGCTTSEWLTGKDWLTGYDPVCFIVKSLPAAHIEE